MLVPKISVCASTRGQLAQGRRLRCASDNRPETIRAGKTRAWVSRKVRAQLGGQKRRDRLQPRRRHATAPESNPSPASTAGDQQVHGRWGRIASEAGLALLGHPRTATGSARRTAGRAHHQCDATHDRKTKAARLLTVDLSRKDRVGCRRQDDLADQEGLHGVFRVAGPAWIQTGLRN